MRSIRPLRRRDASGGEILQSALHRMQESLKMFDFPGGLLPSTYNLTFGRGNTFYKKPKTLETLANLSRAKKLSLQFFQKLSYSQYFGHLKSPYFQEMPNEITNSKFS